MPSVSDILLHEADMLGRLRAQRGEIWGGAIAGAGQAIGQGIAATQDPQRKLAQQRVDDLKALDTAFAQPGGRDEILSRVPGHLRSEVQEHFARADEAAEKVTTAQLAAEKATNEYVYGLAQTIKANKYDPTAAQLSFSHARQTFKGNPSLMNQIDQFERALHGNPTPEFVQSFADPIIQAHESQEKGVVIPQGGTLSRPTSGAVIATGQPKPPTETEVALQASGGDPTKAMTLLKPPAVGMTEVDLAKQLSGGDPAKTMALLKTPMQAPTVVAHQTATEKLAADKEAREAADSRARLGLEAARLQLERDKATGAEDVGVAADVRTTSTGRSFVDLSKYKGKDYHAAQKQAHAAGVFGASAAESDALQNIDVARQNMDLIEKSVGKLPSSPLTRGPKLPLVGVVGPGALATRAEAALQLDPDLAAWGTWRTAAIQAMRALAGSKGLRINRSEIEASVENDIPEMTDTQATAKEKLNRVRKMLMSQENGVMGSQSSGNDIRVGGTFNGKKILKVEPVP